MKKKIDNRQWLLADNKKTDTDAHLREQSEPCGSAITGMRDTSRLSDFVPFVPFTTRAFVVEKLRFFPAALDI